jgi:hypothetical protein
MWVPMAVNETRPAKEHRGREDVVNEFFERALSGAEQRMLPAAREMEGLDEEIALLRTKLRTLAADADAGAFPLLTRGMETLAKLCSVRYRLSQKSRKDLADSVAAMLQSFRSELGIGDDDAA